MSYLTPDRTKPITARKLGDDFDRAAVLETITQNAQNAVRAAEKPIPKQEYPRSIKDRLQRGRAAINAPKRDSVQRMVDWEAKQAEGKGIDYEAEQKELKEKAAVLQGELSRTLEATANAGGSSADRKSKSITLLSAR